MSARFIGLGDRGLGGVRLSAISWLAGWLVVFRGRTLVLGELTPADARVCCLRVRSSVARCPFIRAVCLATFLPAFVRVFSTSRFLHCIVVPTACAFPGARLCHTCLSPVRYLGRLLLLNFAFYRDAQSARGWLVHVLITLHLPALAGGLLLIPLRGRMRNGRRRVSLAHVLCGAG